MPRYDGTGPRGQGPLTGGGRGYCAVELPGPGDAPVVRGFAGLPGWPVYGPAGAPAGYRWPLGAGRRLGRGGRGRGRGRR